MKKLIAVAMLAVPFTFAAQAPANPATDTTKVEKTTKVKSHHKKAKSAKNTTAATSATPATPAQPPRIRPGAPTGRVRHLDPAVAIDIPGRQVSEP